MVQSGDGEEWISRVQTKLLGRPGDCLSLDLISPIKYALTATENYITQCLYREDDD
jgi:hypothetical protein